MITDFPIRPGNISDAAPDYPWPAGKRCAVVPAFDVDAEFAWLQYDAANTDRLVTLSHGGYEARVGVPKLLDYLRSVELKATFFIPGWVVDAHPRMCEAIVKDGHEVGHHGYSHKRPDPADFEVDKQEIDKALELLKRVLGVCWWATARPRARIILRCWGTSATAASFTPPRSATTSAPIATGCATARWGRSSCR